jgi:hypothetical protein
MGRPQMGLQGPDRSNDSGRDQDGMPDGANASSKGNGAPALPWDDAQAARAKGSPRLRVVREHPLAALIVVLLAAAITAVGSIEAARITKTTVPETAGPLYPGDDSAFCGDVTYPDHSYVSVGKKFVKKWALCNTGNVPWTGRFLVPSGQDIGSCEYPVRVPVPNTNPGQKAIVAVTVTPLAPGRCYVPWKMVDANYQFCFPGEEGIWFDVIARKTSG